MSTIGIYTFNNAKDNYGQVLQYLATQEYLDARGHITSLLVPKYEKRKSCFLKCVYRKLRSVLTSKPQPVRTIYSEWGEVIERMEREHPRHFDEFRSKYFRTSHYSMRELSKGVLDVVAVGSDQTWSWFSDYGFCACQKRGIKKIGIAPSMGQCVFSTDTKARIKPLLDDFDLITCREQSGVNLCKEVGVEGHLVLDPTFLLEKSQYERYEESFTLPKRKYILVYMLGAVVDVTIGDIHAFAKENGCDVIYVASQGRDDDYPKCYATIPQWLYVIRHAEFVITNSFHGMAFSIIYRKNFLTLPLLGETKGQNERITVLAHQLGLENRIYKKSLQEILAPIDYSIADKYIIHNREKMSNMLSEINL